MKEKKWEGAGRMGRERKRERENELISSSPRFSSDELAVLLDDMLFGKPYPPLFVFPPYGRSDSAVTRIKVSFGVVFFIRSYHTAYTHIQLFLLAKLIL